MEKSAKIGGKGSPGGAAGNSGLRTRDRDEALGGKINENRRQKGSQKGGESFQPANSGPSRGGGRG